MSFSPVIDNVAQGLRRFQCDGEGMVVAVSGGADSVALLRALVACEAPVRPRHLVAAHLNHQLRAGESDADEEFVRTLVLQLQAGRRDLLEYQSQRVDVAGLAEVKHANLETTARSARYDWLVGVARERNLRWIATGHTADDQAETVLHRLLRGAGIKGLRGIAPRRTLAPGIAAIRPLLHVTRKEVLAFLHAAGQAFREDRSNVDPSFTRNRIRHQLLPLLAEQFHPRVGDILRRLAEQTDELFSWIECMAKGLLDQVERPRAGTMIILARDGLTEAPPYLVREVFRLIWEREGWPQDGVGFEDWKRVAALARGEIASIDLPGQLRARVRGTVVQIGPIE